MTKETVTVTQADRIAAAKVHPYSHNSALILDGERDGTDIVRAACFGRIEATRELEVHLAEAQGFVIEASNGSNEVAHNLAKAATAIRRLIAERDRLREQIVLAANRLDVCVVNAIADGQHKLSVTYKDWAAEARAALGEGGGDA